MDNHSWVIMGDFNVTLKLNEHSISDHCPVVLSILEKIKKINAPFRFMSYVADKPEFLPIVSNLKEKLKIAQAKVDANPHDSIVKAEEAKILLEYKESMSDEIEEDLVTTHFVRHFQDFSHKVVKPITDIDELFSTKLTNEDNDMMFKEVTDVEIKEALFDIGDNKSLGPDRYMGLNAILITLVPKVSNASKVTKCIPIACCNDNILLSQELLKGYDRKVGPKRCALKIDIAKAYDTLVDKARCKVQDLKNKVLLYVGRLQLVDSTMVESCKKERLRFHGSMCHPKNQGGLGLKMLGEWNEVLLSKHIWNIATRKESLWVKWFHMVKLKGRSIWDVQKDSNDSWSWKALMDIRERIRPHIIHKIGNEKQVSMWYENWSEVGPLDQYISKRDIYDARLSDYVFVANVTTNGRWKWLEEWL
ncbi:hypothetical protein Tco_0800987 [Tanacetum coccineum]|uniref:RNA-directed DNA polymerase, eukaryota, reverse transcriptase zinc-binding domain protein n=1 Tax=Tanacetum coccineum TaxID=301880 RepID=A0ABQ4ZUN6_9ASTR